MKQIQKLLKSRIWSRLGQSLTSTVIGVAVLGMVGAATASMISTHRTADSALSASADAAAILDSFTSEIRNTTPYHKIEHKFGRGGQTFLVGNDYQVKTSVVKTCNSDTGTGNANCDLMDVLVEIYDKASGEKILSQTVKRVYTHFAESQNFTADADFVLPEDTIGFAYESEGNEGSTGSDASETSNLLQVRSKACATNYQPNSAGTACVACPAPSGTKQYRSGDCTIGTCGTGKKANSAKTGCEAITCPSGKKLEGDNCVEPSPPFPTNCASGASLGAGFCPSGEIPITTGSGIINTTYKCYPESGAVFIIHNTGKPASIYSSIASCKSDADAKWTSCLAIPKSVVEIKNGKMYAKKTVTISMTNHNVSNYAYTVNVGGEVSPVGKEYYNKGWKTANPSVCW